MATTAEQANGPSTTQAENEKIAPASEQNANSPPAAAPTREQKANSEEKDKPADDSPKKSDKSDKPDEKQPPGGFDSTPIPKRPAGYTVKFTIHRAVNLPMGDINSFSSDPYVIAQLNTDTPKRHREDPYLRFRTQTIQKHTDPQWDAEWIVANVPASGFVLKLHVFDEDPADKDDLLGIVHVKVPEINQQWRGIKNEEFKIKAGKGSKRAYLMQILSTCFREDKHLHGQLFVSAEVLGRTEEDGQNGRLYTLGPLRWIRHSSPMLGRLVKTKDGDDEVEQAANGGQASKKISKYDFQANQIQLQGPVPAELYHRFVEFKPWVGRMFTSAGLSGMVLGKALHHQHQRVYNFTRSTLWGNFPEGPSTELTKQFLDLVHHDSGGRIFTYVLTLDALWRFTETGKEFGIDMLSKHTMHSNVSIYIAFSGEFFIRRLKHPQRPPPPDPIEEASQEHHPNHQANKSHPPEDVSGGPPNDDPPRDPRYFELVIDNDSGTYRPNAKTLPLLKDFLARSLPGLHILTLDCNEDADRMNRMKSEQRERKKKEGQAIVYTQGSRSSSISSSDEEDLDDVQAGFADGNEAEEDGPLRQAARVAKQQQKAKLDKFKRQYGHFPGEGRRQDGEAAEASNLPGDGSAEPKQSTA